MKGLKTSWSAVVYRESYNSGMEKSETKGGNVQTETDQKPILMIRVLPCSGSSWHGISTWPEGMYVSVEGSRHCVFARRFWMLILEDR